MNCPRSVPTWCNKESYKAGGRGIGGGEWRQRRHFTQHKITFVDRESTKHVFVDVGVVFWVWVQGRCIGWSWWWWRDDGQ